jgi:hypothetical protein
VELGRAAPEAIAQLLDHHREARSLAGQSFASYHGGLGSVAGRTVPVQHWQQVRKARNLAQNVNCVVCTERAQEAVIVEGTAEIADVEARRKFLPQYERKYKFDMSAMKQDILSMKEPVFAVRPRVVFGLWEKHFVGKSTRWKLEYRGSA